MNKIIKYLLITSFLIISTGCNNQKINGINEVEKSMKIVINDNEYNIFFEDNETAKSFINLLPKEFDMIELNGNEKYVYLDTNLPTNPSSIQNVNIGDVMLYNNNCLVIFYKSFNTSYSYTKIGHINDLPNLSNKNIKVLFKSKNCINNSRKIID